MNNKFLCTIICLLLSASLIYATGNDNTGTSAANFLKIGIGPRGTAMGGAFVAHVNDVSALYWNPAGIASINALEVSVTHTDWILDFGHNFFAVAYPMGNLGTIGLSLNSLSMGDMERTSPSEPNGTGSFFSASDMALGLAYARRLTDRFAVGVKVKFVQESISYSSASTIAVDAGTQFETAFYGMRIGMSISNFGGKMTLKGTDQLTKADIDEVIGSNPMKEARLETEGWSLPLLFRVGASLDVLKRDYATLTCNLDYNDPRDVNPYGTFGAEYSWNNILFLRGGINYFPEDFDEQQLADEEELVLSYGIRLSFGAGLNLKVPGIASRVKLDYAYTDLGILTTVHSFSFTFGL